ncbi:MAG TPA: hypothetical protein VNL14_14985 [Candidatus Acidoferrales bacterium]|nr:hypothetical protein [Candidatus Acidoferrales bacterium]
MPVLGLLLLCSCTVPVVGRNSEDKVLREALSLAREVKAFEKTLAIEPTEALARDGRGSLRPKSMLWIWLQKLGTIATRGPVDVHIGIKFALPQDQVPLDRIYHAPGYSQYVRRGNQFGDKEALITLDFARESTARKVTVIVHEDLHDDRNFALPWEEEEALITPLGMIVALRFLESRSDEAAAAEMKRAIEEERRLSRELLALIGEALQIFASAPLDEARRAVFRRLDAYPAYKRYYDSQLKDQDAERALEAKLSHDLAYYKYFDRVVALSEKIGELKVLIAELKKARPAGDGSGLDGFLADLEARYRGR